MKRKKREKVERRVYDVAADVYFYVVTEKPQCLLHSIGTVLKYRIQGT